MSYQSTPGVTVHRLAKIAATVAITTAAALAAVAAATPASAAATPQAHCHHPIVVEDPYGYANQGSTDDFGLSLLGGGLLDLHNHAHAWSIYS